VIGGLLRIEGAWLGAFAFIVIQNYVRDFHVPGLSMGGTLFGGSFNTVVGIIFLVIVLVSPGGLMGIWDRAFTRRGRRRGTPPDEPVLSIETM
jgi:branched-chain amino acid transport system permease protein